MFAKRERMKLGIKKNGRGTKKMLQGRVGAQNPISKAHENTYFQSKKKKCHNKHLCAYIVMHTRKYFYKLEN